jgi:hypothetical protein
MKNTLFAAIFSTSILLTACGGSGSNNGNGDGGNASNADATIAATPTPKSADSNVDWEKPLYVINDKGDTLETWTYNAKGLVIRNCSRYDLIDECDYEYDEQGRLVWKRCVSKSGNIHESEYKYTYNGNVRIGEGSERAEGWQSYFDIKERYYYLDTECKYDTLTQIYEMEISWDDADNYNHDISNAKPTSYANKQYKKFGDKYLVTEENWFRRDYDDESKLVNSFRFLYEYNDKGLLTKEIQYDSNQKLSATITYEYNADNLIIKKTYDNGTNKTVTTYTYNDNVQTETNSEGTFKTFYQQK